MAAGLTFDEMLAALTTTPASLLGIEEIAGTIESGKQADFVLVEGELFAEDAKVREVWIGGVRHPVTPRPVFAISGDATLTLPDGSTRRSADRSRVGEGRGLRGGEDRGRRTGERRTRRGRARRRGRSAASGDRRGRGAEAARTGGSCDSRLERAIPRRHARHAARRRGARSRGHAADLRGPRRRRTARRRRGRGWNDHAVHRRRRGKRGAVRIRGRERRCVAGRFACRERRPRMRPRRSRRPPAIRDRIRSSGPRPASPGSPLRRLAVVAADGGPRRPIGRSRFRFRSARLVASAARRRAGPLPQRNALDLRARRCGRSGGPSRRGRTHRLRRAPP